MSPKAIISLIVAAFSAAAVLQGCGGSDSCDPDTVIPKTLTNDTLSTLVTALGKADLVGALSACGPFTVFVPNNAAFDALPYDGALLQYLLANVDKLKEVLQYHVASGKFGSSDLKDGQEVPMLAGGKTKVKIDGSNVMINDAKVIKADQGASNGVVHWINQVLVPEGLMMSLPTIPTLAAQADLSTLVTAVTRAKLVDTLTAEDKAFTVFAPTNAAFDALEESLLQKLLEPGNLKSLQQVLTYHVHVGSKLSKSLQTGTKVSTVEGQELDVTITGDTVTIGLPGRTAKVTKADQLAVNGVVHVIDTVLVPPDFSPPKTFPDIPTLATNSGLSTLVTALTKGELVDALTDKTKVFTVFAPTDTAFSALPAGLLDKLLLPANKAKLQQILKYHVHAGDAYLLSDMKLSMKVSTLEGTDLDVTINGTTVTIGKDAAKVVNGNAFADNGVVQLIDKVLVPPDFEPPSQSLVV